MRAVLTAVLATALATGAVAQPRLAGQRPAIDSVEGGLWSEGDRMERLAAASGTLNRDPALRAYVRQVACKVAAEYCDQMRVNVMDAPFFNASMAPNGYMEVLSGALLRVRDEDELAFVLGHEVGHFAENHSIERWNNMKATATTVLVLGAAVGAAGMYYGVNTSGLIDVTRFAGLAAVFSYGRGQELEADRLGFARASAAGYSADGGAGLWTSIVQETAESDFPKIRKGGARGSIFNTHPIEQERIAALQRLQGPVVEAAAREAGRKRLRDVIRPHLADWLRDELRRRDYGQTLFILKRLAASGEDQGVLEYFRGETYRQRRKDGDVLLARDAYALAIAHADVPVAAWRELGEMNRRLGDRDKALTAYRAYLAHAPNADDAWLAQDAIKTLEGSAS